MPDRIASACTIITCVSLAGVAVASPVEETGRGTVAAACSPADTEAESTIDLDGGIAAFCPGLGNCCIANGFPGCDNTECCNLVCSQRGDCCVYDWDDNCAALAVVKCDPSACEGGDPCPGEGDCCSANDTPACDDAFCCDLVCTHEPFCCQGEWDQDCAAFAVILCDDLCPPADPCPGEGDCCLAGDTPACDDADCCNTDCEEDPFCCAGEWDSICADLAHALCRPLCEGPCPGEGDCCTPHSGRGCEDRECCDAVAAASEDCRHGEWDATCADMAAILCTDLCGGDCPGEGDCCEINSTPACSNRACCKAVCTEDDFCCFLSWDSDCTSWARDLCPDLCGAPPVCPGSGECCLANGTPGCDNAICCERVCAGNASCCTDEWDSECADLAGYVCGLTCWCPLFGDFDESRTIDLADFAWAQRCFSGADTAPVDPDCACGDVAGNGDVDLMDIRAFVHLLTGP